MSVALADFYTAIASAWDDSGLDVTFQALWGSDVVADNFQVLHDQEASPGQPLPYCVLDQITSSSIVSRMSADGYSVREIRDIPVKFNVYAKEVTNDDRSAKAIAAYLVEELMKVFGGHPTVSPTGTLTLSNGNHLITQYQTDYGVRLEDGEHQWIVSYIFRLDVPVAV